MFSKIEQNSAALAHNLPSDVLQGVASDIQLSLQNLEEHLTTKSPLTAGAGKTSQSTTSLNALFDILFFNKTSS